MQILHSVINECLTRLSFYTYINILIDLITLYEAIYYSISYDLVSVLYLPDPKRMQLCVVALWRSYRSNYINIRRARRAPNKHYEIPFVRSMPCSSYTSSPRERP